MLRTVLFGLVASLALGTVAACGTQDDAPAATGAVAGKVIDVTGVAHATRAGTPQRVLAKGTEIYSDDVIVTTSGVIEIELFHNDARWSLQGGKRVRVDQSLAWGLTRQQASAAVEHATAAAGRNAERSAADTSATTGTEAMPMPEPRAAAPAAAPMAPPAARSASEETADESAKQQGQRPAGGSRSGTGAAADKSAGGAAPSRGGEARGPAGGMQAAPQADHEGASDDRRQLAPPPPPSPQRTLAQPTSEGTAIRALLEQRRAEFRACLVPGAPHATIVIRLAKGTPTFELVAAGDRGDKMRGCVAAVVKTIKFPAIDAQGSIELAK